MRRVLWRPAVALLAVLLLSSCEYVKLLRPSVLKQLNPRVVRLVNTFPQVDDQNEEIVGRLFAHGGLGRAERGRDGVWRATIRVPPGEYMWYPAIIHCRRRRAAFAAEPGNGRGFRPAARPRLTCGFRERHRAGRGRSFGTDQPTRLPSIDEKTSGGRAVRRRSLVSRSRIGGNP